MNSSKYCILFNPLSGNGKGRSEAEKLSERINATGCVDMTKISSYSDFFAEHPDESIIICGGDGTLNRFVNDTDGLGYTNSIFYYASGSGNDFLRDIDGNQEDVICIDRHIKNLPVCTINGKDYRFINGIGFGIDGYCCQVGDELRARNDGKPINYTSIAIKGLLFHYKPTKAKVTVDGVEHSFKRVWIAPTMHGRFYGGGMMPTPEQDRFNGEGKISVMLFHSTGRLRTLMIFPSIFKGEHVKNTFAVTVLSGKNITVEFDSPRPLQIDGETILGVTKYTVCGNTESKSKTAVANTISE